MERQRYIAVLAFRHPAAHLALYHRRKATAVLEEDGLLAILQGFPHGSQELRRIGTLHHLAMLQVLDIHHLDFGQLDALVTSFHLDKTILALLGIVVALQRRRSST